VGSNPTLSATLQREKKERVKRQKVEPIFAFLLLPFTFLLVLGKVQEWFNWQHWKCCVRGTAPWVRIPPFPPLLVGLYKTRRGFVQNSSLEVSQ
jgi:hypothetical protein